MSSALRRDSQPQARDHLVGDFEARLGLDRCDERIGQANRATGTQGSTASRFRRFRPGFHRGSTAHLVAHDVPTTLARRVNRPYLLVEMKA